MGFLAYTHWLPPLHDGSFVLLMKGNMTTKQVIAVIGASGKLSSALAKTIIHF
jgi:hypothetical protein